MSLSLLRCGIALTVLLGNHQHPISLRVPTFSSLGPPHTTSAALALPFSCASAHRRFCPLSRRRPPMARVFNEEAESSQRHEEGVGAAATTVEVCEAARSAAEPAGLERDAEHMRRALELAAKGVGRTRPNPAVGCVIVDRDGVVVGEGFHPRAGEPHAEVWAIREAGERAKGGTAYVTLEPCNHYGRTPPCTTALLDSGVSRVVAGMVDPDLRTAGSGLRRLADAGLDVAVGVEGAACQAFNSAFVHRISEKSCYGVLHCSLGGSDTLELEDTLQEADLAVSPECHSYQEYDAIVVEGRHGVAKLAACMQALPRTALRVVLVSSSDGLEKELGPVMESGLWEDLPERTIVVVPAAEINGDGAGRVRSWLALRGITIVEFSLPLPPPLGADTDAITAANEAAAAATVSGELYRRGLLTAAWEVSPGTAKRALEGGHIQRALVRKRRTNGTNGGSDDGEQSDGTVEGGEEEEEAVVRAFRRLSGKDGVRARRNALARVAPGVKNLTEVLLPVAAFAQLPEEA